MKKNKEQIKISHFILARFVSLVLVLALASPVIIIAQSGKINFTGEWILNAEKSTQPQGGQGGGMRMGGNFVATQDANLLTVVRTRTGQDGQAVTTTMKYTLDGKESINTSQRGESKSTAKWAADGKTLTIETSRTMEMNGETMTMKSTEVWVLTSPSILTVSSTRQSPNGEVKSTMVYDKK